MSIKNPRIKELPSVEYLNECFELRDDDTLIWKFRPLNHFGSELAWRQVNAKRVGTVAGTVNVKGHGYIGLDNDKVVTNRVIYKMRHGIDPCHKSQMVTISVRRKVKQLPPLTYLQECFEVRDGALYWKARPRHHFNTDRGWKIVNSNMEGKPAGYFCGDHNVWRVSINRTLYLSEQIIDALS